MIKLSHSELHDRIASLERRLERRRLRLLEDTKEATSAASQVAAYALPAAAAIGAGALAVWLTRRRRRTPIRMSFRNPFVSDRAATRRGVRWASIAGLVGSAIRIGTSPAARAAFNALRRRRQVRY